MRKIIFVLSICSICLFCDIDVLNAQSVTTIYVASSDDIPNPERGWYDDYYSYSSAVPSNTTFIPLDSATLASNRDRSNITLILRLFYLHQYLDSVSIGDEYLAMMQDDFDAIRKAGVKCIIRFAYSNSQGAETWDATPEIAMSHINSLTPILQANGDVIAGLQAGFVGAWGEWYYTENFSGFGLSPDEEDQTNRRLLVEALLEAVPVNVSVQGRTPAIMKNIAQSDDPIFLEDAFDGSYKSRLGHHNDCFLSNASDQGTYTSLTSDIAYLTETTKYTITGGETCDASNSYSDCDVSMPRMKELHWTYLNRDYNRQVYAKWIEQGCYEEVTLSLGYRINLVSTVLPAQVSAGEALSFDISLENIGFSAPTQNKDLQIVLQNITTSEIISFDYPDEDIDIRYWFPGDISLSGSVTIPDDLADGNYKVGISLKDQYSSLSVNSSYAIRFANFGLWNDEIGVNEFDHVLMVGDVSELVLPNVPTDLVAVEESLDQINLTWTDASDDELSFEIIRSIGGTDSWKELVASEAGETAFSDIDLTEPAVYYYRIRSRNEVGYSDWSAIASATIEGAEVMVTSVDGVRAGGFNVYPNPSEQGDLIIEFESKSSRKITVHNLKGVKIIELNTDKDAVLVSRDALQAGVYLVTVNDKEVIQTKRVILTD